MSQAKRVLNILKDLLESKKVCVKELADRFKINERSIQRDLKILKEFLGEALVGSRKGCYSLLSKSDILNKIINIKDSEKIRDFFEFITLLDKDLASIFEDSLDFLKDIELSTKEIFHLHENPLERPPKTEIFQQIKHAVQYRKYINMEYFENEQRDFKNVKPIKIVYAKGNWYLASITKNYKMNWGFKFFRINFIKKIEVLNKTFQKDREALEFVDNFQSLFQDYKKESYKVVLSVDNQIIRHFKVKKYLKSQKILETNENCTFISYYINNEMEILPLVKMWIPHIKIVSPPKLKQKLLKDIKSFINSGQH